MRRWLAPIIGQCPSCFLSKYDPNRHEIFYSDRLEPWSVKNMTADFVFRAAIKCKDCGRVWAESVNAATMPPN